MARGVLARRMLVLFTLTALAATASADQSIRATARYQTVVDSQTATGPTRALAIAQAPGPQPQGRTPSAAAAAGQAIGGTGPTGNVWAIVDGYALDPFSPPPPPQQRFVVNEVDVHSAGFFRAVHSNPGVTRVPVRVNFRFFGEMSAYSDAEDAGPAEVSLRAEGRISAAGFGERGVSHQGYATVDAVAGSQDGDDWDGVIAEADEENPDGRYVVLVEDALLFDAPVGRMFRVDLSLRLYGLHANAGGTFTTADFFNERDGDGPDPGAWYELSSPDAGVTFEVVPEPSAVLVLTAAAPLLLGRPKRVKSRRG